MPSYWVTNAAQVCSDRRYTWHHAPEESQAAADAGYPYGFGDNLTVFTGTADAAQRAVDNWSNSSGHFEKPVCKRISLFLFTDTQYLSSKSVLLALYFLPIPRFLPP